jgi:hypothetical protein
LSQIICCEKALLCKNCLAGRRRLCIIEPVMRTLYAGNNKD